jgi:serine/threonine protein kinase
MKERRFSDKASLEDAYVAALNRLKLQHPNILRMLGMSNSTERGLCSTNFYLRLYFVYFENDLRSEYAKRLTKKKVFSDNELNIISENIQMGLLETHVNGLIHGDVRPEMIGLVKDPKTRVITQAVLLDRLIDTSSPSQVQTTRMLNKQPLFVSPELYKYINIKDKSKQMYGRQKNDLFGLGMCLLQVGTNKPKLQNMYQSEGEFDRVLMSNTANQFARIHGMHPQLCNSVNEYLGLQVAAIPIEERRIMERVEHTQVNPSNGQPPYKQVKVKNAEFIKKKDDKDWMQVTSWKTIKTTIEENETEEIVHHQILGKQANEDVKVEVEGNF